MADSHPIFARVYEQLLDRAEDAWLREMRRDLVSSLPGDVLEIGAGTGLNIPHYQRASRVVLAEPDPAMRARLLARVSEASVPIELAAWQGETLAADAGSFDVVVSTLVLCSVRDVAATLREVRRVLRPGGQLVFIEHVLGDGTRARFQHALRPVWSFLMGGCQCDRRTVEAIEEAGFTTRELRRFSGAKTGPLVSPFVRGLSVRE